MSTTLRDYGRHSEKYGEIGFYYAFNMRFWFGQHMVAPDDVLTWCRENCKGYYKVTGYTHESSKRGKRGVGFDSKVMYADKVYLSDESDAVRLKLTFDVRDTKVMRPRLKRKKAKR